ncbi:MAG: YqgE/AlgH family protein [Crocinitomicaceae bacterium]
MLDLNVYNKLEPKKGRLLITEPFLDGEYFHRAVILLCEHNEEGSFGFVLNNYVDIGLDSFEGIPDFDTRISTGGPVSTKNLYYIHTLGDKLEGSMQVHGNLYAGGDFEKLKDMMAKKEVAHNQIRFFLGYSGWVEKQLEGELKHNSWLVSEIKNVDDIMDVENENIWADYMERQGGKYKAFAHFPKNPTLN